MTGTLMRVEPLRIAGVMRFIPTIHRDERGYFTRTFDAASASAVGIDPTAFVQDSQSRSRRGAVRGLHVRAGGGESKLVRCSHGSILDVLVDLRPFSASYLRVERVPLDDVDHTTLYIPRGVAHGWQALSEVADVCYRIDVEHDPSEDVTVYWDDAQFSVGWPKRVTVMSEKDRHAPTWEQVRDEFDRVRPKWYTDDGGMSR